MDSFEPSLQSPGTVAGWIDLKSKQAGSHSLTHIPLLTHPASAPILPVGSPVHQRNPLQRTWLPSWLSIPHPSSRSRLPSAALPGSRLASLLPAPAPLAHRSLPGALPFVDRLAQTRRLLTLFLRTAYYATNTFLEQQAAPSAQPLSRRRGSSQARTCLLTLTLPRTQRLVARSLL